MDFSENFEPEFYPRHYTFSKDVPDIKLLQHYETVGKEQGLMVPAKLKLDCS